MTIVIDLPEYKNPDDLRRVIADLESQITSQEKELGKLKRMRGYYRQQLQELITPPADPAQIPSQARLRWLAAFALRWQRRQR